ncbi:hypothetical protein ONE63_003675 [Megalurothrips usitatus]|uniref:Uncharacterized protein n=1 Tax=Megalurothrips usitatus TaxID=439358 RepID=A0AAV7X6U7_9NEOP|nr:hypothetical protein ONE63_003675 [Megalurothrips usitatus]
MSNDHSENLKGDESSNLVKKRFTSILKFNIGGSNNCTNRCPSSPGRLPLPGPTRHASPGPPPPSPDPPPRLSRLGLSDGTSSSSPLAGRRGFLDVSPVRRGVLDSSPSLPRRYVSPSPPQPPPRRLSTEGGPNSFSGSSGLLTASGMNSTSGTNSTPGSPQIRRFDSIRARFHYTPQPQRRMFGATSDFNDL